MEIFELMMEKGADDWNLFLKEACKHGNIKFVEFLINKGANNWDKCFKKACESGNKELVDILIEKGKIFNFFF